MIRGVNLFTLRWVWAWCLGLGMSGLVKEQ